MTQQGHETQTQPEENSKISESGEKNIKLIGELGERLNTLLENIRNPEERASARAKLREAVGMALRDLAN